MARIKNVELPKTKSLFIGLTAIHGIGQSTGKKICKDAGLDPDMKVQDLSLDDEAKIRAEVDKYLVEGDLRREVQMNIKNKMEINSYQGTRHKKVFQFMDKEHLQMLELVRVKVKLLQIRRKQLNNK